MRSEERGPVAQAFSLRSALLRLLLIAGETPLARRRQLENRQCFRQVSPRAGKSFGS